MKKCYNLREKCFNVTNYSNDNFVGIIYEKNDFKVYFPIGYQIPDTDDECRISILNILKLISLEKTLNNDNKFGITTGENYEIPINSYLWLINDYLKNGLYFDIEKEYVQRQNGKINWKKTLKSKSYISNNSIIYLNPFIEKNSFENNIITSIHIHCLNISINKIGWLFGNIPTVKEIMDNKTNNSKYLISIIENEMLKSFDDRKKMLLVNLKKVLDYTSGEKNSIVPKKYGTNSFEYIWEYMVDDIYKTDDVEKYFPSSSWHILNWEKFNSSKLRPDTILIHNNDLYIIDSKYYKFGITGNVLHLPSTDSVQKQITYGEYAKNNMDFQNIYNAFIVPYNKLDNKFNLKNDIEYVGYAKSNWKEKTNNIYEHVSLILIDTKYLIDCFYNRQNKDTEYLINSIKSVIKTFDEK